MNVNLPTAFTNSVAALSLTNSSRNSGISIPTGIFLLVGGSYFFQPFSICASLGTSSLIPWGLMYLPSYATLIVVLNSEIAPETVPTVTCLPLPKWPERTQAANPVRHQTL